MRSMEKKVKVTYLPTESVKGFIGIYERLGYTAYVKKIDDDFYLITN